LLFPTKQSPVIRRLLRLRTRPPRNDILKEETAMPKPITQNTLFYRDNLPILREYIPDESFDLIYLDPPFNSSRS